MIKKFIPAFLAIVACGGMFVAIQSMLPPPASASGIVPAIVPALVPTANKTSTTSTVFALASSSALTASSAVCTNANGDMTTTACTTNAVTSTTPVTVSAAVATDQQLMELSLTAGYLNSLGRPFTIFGAGVYSLPVSTPTMTYKIKLCTVSGCGSGTVVTLVSIVTTASVGNVTTVPWNLNTVATTAATGATGNLETHGRLSIDLGAASTTADTVFNDTNTAVSSNIDLTAALFVDFTVAFSTSSTSNVGVQREGVVSPGGSTSGGGGGSGAMTQISKQVLGSPAANFTFSSIPATSNNLLLTLDAASAGAVVSDNIAIQFNGDTATNYNFELGLAEGTSSSGGSITSTNSGGVAGTANQGCGAVAGTSAPANESVYSTISILNYAGTTFRKHALCSWGNNGSDSSNNNGNNTGQNLLTWKSTAAINSIKLIIVSGNNFATGSTAILYGIN